MKCRWCGKRVLSRSVKPRRSPSMCQTCSRKHAKKIRDGIASGRRTRDHEPTKDELEATIAQQMKRLPAWWEASSRQAE